MGLTQVNSAGLAVGAVINDHLHTSADIALSRLDTSGDAGSGNYLRGDGAWTAIDLTTLSASNLTSGTVPTARLGSGTASSSNFLRGDGTWTAISTDVVGDTSPQLGGDLDVNGNEIVSASNGHIDINPNGTGNISLKTGVGGTTNLTAGGDVVFAGHFTNGLCQWDYSQSQLEFWDGVKASFGSDEDLVISYDASAVRTEIISQDTVHLKCDYFQLISKASSGRAIYLDESNSFLELGFDGGHDAHFKGNGVTFLHDVTLNAQSDLRFADSDSSNYVAFQAPATISSNVTWTLPAADGSSGQVLSTNASGTLSWATVDLTNLNASNLTSGTIPDARFPATLPAISGANLTNVNATTLDSIDSGSFLRSDADDSMSADLTIQGILKLTNSTANEKLILSGSSDPIIRLQEGTTNKVQLQWDSTNNVIYLWNEEVNKGFQLGTDPKWYDGTAYRTLWTAGNHGAGSGLDADTLDGQQGSYYLDYTNFSNKPTIPTNNNQLSNGAGYVTSSGWTSSNDGSGSGLDADYLDGQHGSYYLNYNNLSNKPSVTTALYIDVYGSGTTNSRDTARSWATGSVSVPNNCLFGVRWRFYSQFYINNATATIDRDVRSLWWKNGSGSIYWMAGSDDSYFGRAQGG